MSLTPRLDRLSDNLIINGNFDFWQRNTSSVIAAAASDKNYVADRWSHTSYFASGSKTVSRSVDVPAGTSATYSMSTAITSTISLTHATANYHANAGVYRMEGLDALRLYGQTVTLQFWVKSTLSGLYSIAFGNNYDAGSYKYVSTYTINAANTWEQKSVTLEMTSAIVSNFAKDNTQGFFVAFGIAANTNGDRIKSSLDQWIGPSSGGLIASTANRTDFLTAGNSIKIAQVKLGIGSGISEFSFAGKTNAQELGLCQRYYEKSYNIEVIPGAINDGRGSVRFYVGGSNNISTVGGCRVRVEYKVQKRALPTVTTWSWATGATGVIRYSGGSPAASDQSALPAEDAGTHSVTLGSNNVTTNSDVGFHFTADAEL